MGGGGDEHVFGEEYQHGVALAMPLNVNMLDILVTAFMSHVFNDWLNELAFLNIVAVFNTALVSHVFKAWLNAVASSNKDRIVVTLLESHV
jgi:hypothetical protein